MTTLYHLECFAENPHQPFASVLLPADDAASAVRQFLATDTPQRGLLSTMLFNGYFRFSSEGLFLRRAPYYSLCYDTFAHLLDHRSTIGAYQKAIDQHFPQLLKLLLQSKRLRIK